MGDGGEAKQKHSWKTAAWGDVLLKCGAPTFCLFPDFVAFIVLDDKDSSWVP